MNQVILLLAYFSIVIGYSYSKGWFSVGGLALLLTGFLLVGYAFIKRKYSRETTKVKETLNTMFSMGLFLSIAFGNDLWDHDMNGFVSLAMLSARLLLWLALLISLLYIIPAPFFLRHVNRIKFFILTFIAVFLRFLMLKIVLFPQVDIFFNIKFRAMEILSLHNPYSLSYTYPPNLAPLPSHYPYGPLSLIVLLPFNLMGDPRLAIIAADIITTVLLYLLNKKGSPSREMIPLLYLYHPQALFFAILSALDNIIVSLLAIFFYLFQKKKYYMAFLALAFIGGIKHAYTPLMIFPLRMGLSRKILLPFLVAFAFLGTSYGIFILWDLPGIKHNLLDVFAAFPQTWLVPASLSVQSLLTKQSIVTPQLNFKPSILFGLVPFVIVFLSTFIFSGKSLYRIALGIILSFSTFVFFAPYALFQYYFLISSLVLIAMSLNHSDRIT